MLLKTGSTLIATVMKRLLTGYAMHYNRRHKRSGHLFQNRYKSILCQEDVYLLELVRYIHLNPCRKEMYVFPVMVILLMLCFQKQMRYTKGNIDRKPRALMLTQ